MDVSAPRMILVLTRRHDAQGRPLADILQREVQPMRSRIDRDHMRVGPDGTFAGLFHAIRLDPEHRDHAALAGNIEQRIRRVECQYIQIATHIERLRNTHVKPYYGTDANAVATRAAHAAHAAHAASLTMDPPVDIINATIDELIARDVELPAFSTLDRLTEQIHARTQSRLRTHPRFLRGRASL